ncbi:MAG: Fic family protein [Candidatus Marinimicrobia bacterium]|nr:Fic family protein [Candidatus Neomarinimicrobiota bacterium]
MYTPQYKITNEILANIGLVEAAKEVIKNAPLIPIYESRFKKDALLRTVHHGTHIEGNDLTLNEVRKAIEGEEFVARERDIQEVINYRNVLKYIDGLKRELGASPRYSQKMVKEINRIACERVITDGRAGQYRQTQVVLRNSATGEVAFRPPPAVEVPFLMEDFFEWLNSTEARRIHPALRAGIAHYYLVSVHPFVEANGRTTRAFATLILFAEGYEINKFFSLEDYFDKDAARYYQSLMAVDKQAKDLAKRDLTPWLEYFTQAMGVELTRIKEKVKRLSVDIKIKGRVGKQVPLNERQIKLVEYLEEHGSLTTAEARKVADKYSDDTLVRDFNYFVKKGLVKKQGKTKAARYVLK